MGFFYFQGGDSSVHSRDDFIDSADDDDDDDDDMSTYGGHLVRLVMALVAEINCKTIHHRRSDELGCWCQ